MCLRPATVGAVPQPLRKLYPGLDLQKAQEQVRIALRRAARACGGQKEFVRRLNEKVAKLGQKTITPQAFSWWLSEGTFVDERFWEAIELITDYAVTRRHLRPDMYQDETPELLPSDLNPLLDACRWIEEQVPPGNPSYLNALATTKHLHEMRHRIMRVQRRADG